MWRKGLDVYKIYVLPLLRPIGLSLFRDIGIPIVFLVQSLVLSFAVYIILLPSHSIAFSIAYFAQALRNQLKGKSGCEASLEGTSNGGFFESVVYKSFEKCVRVAILITDCFVPSSWRSELMQRSVDLASADNLVWMGVLLMIMLMQNYALPDVWRDA